MALKIERTGRSTTGPRRELAHTLIIGLVNNMPDTALTATEGQFSALLGAAADGLDVQLRFTSIPEVRRGRATVEHIQSTYWPLEKLLDDTPDALIVTGTEPVAASLCDEPYWGSLIELLRWTRTNTASSIWSCLAAHAAVQVLDGIRREKLNEKRFGLFEHSTAGRHPLLAGLAPRLQMPHSRWNDLPVSSLRSAGYEILSQGVATGADLFVKQDDSLLVFFQGHPEYETHTLLREYRRDVGRYLRGEQQHYPQIPANYFSANAVDAYTGFQRKAVSQRNPELLAQFPTAADADLVGTWRPSAVRIYHNWLLQVSAAKNRNPREDRLTL